MSLEDQLKNEILSRYKSIRSFTTAINIPYSTLDSVFRRGLANAGVTTMLKIFAALDLDIESITTGKLCKCEKAFENPTLINMSTEDVQHIQKYHDLDKHGKRMVDMVIAEETARMEAERRKREAQNKKKSAAQPVEEEPNVIPFRLSEQSASAGTGTYLGPESFETIYVRDNSLTRRAAFGVPVSGNSMEPRYYDGDILIVEAASDIRIGEVGVFTLDGEGYVKERGHGTLISLNPEYGPISMNESIRCNGRVIGVLDPNWISE